MKGKRIAVFAKDDAGLQKALFLTNWTKKIDILAPTDFEPTATRRRQLRNVGLNLVRSDAVTLKRSPGGDSIVVGVGGQAPRECAVAYVELGCQVKDRAFANLRGLKTAEGGFIVATAEQRTSIPGLYAAGDCVNRLGQVSVALGQAAIAATNIHEELNHR